MSFVPRPVLTFAVGVIGHRTNKLHGSERIRNALTQVFADLGEACRREFEDAGEFYAPNAEPDQAAYRMRLLSGFAEGADLIAAEVAPPDWGLEAVLASPRGRYRAALLPQNASDGQDHSIAFDKALARAGKRVVELPEVAPRASRGATVATEAQRKDAAQAGYARQAEFLLKQIDLLVAVWDGERSETRGQTGDTVLKALRNGLSVVWISAGADRAPVLLEQAGDIEQDPERLGADLDARLGAVVARIVAPPTDDVQEAFKIREDDETSARERLEEFLAAKQWSTCWWTAYDALKRGWRFWTWRLSIKLDSPDDVAARWRAFLDCAPDGEGFRARIEDVLLPRYYAADHVATRIAHVYRSAYVLTYLFAVLSVFVATLAAVVALQGVPDELWYRTIFIGLEFAPVVAILLLVRAGQKRRWHGRWLEARALAERLRHVRILGLVGECEVVRNDSELSATGAVWTSWYLRATIRELGLPYGAFDAAYQAKALQAAQDYEWSEQLLFNQGNRSALGRLNRRLHDAGALSFIVTAATLALSFVALLGFEMAFGVKPTSEGPKLQSWLARALDGVQPIFDFIAGFLPALGAAIAGIRSTGDFEGFAERSRETLQRLGALREPYSRASLRLDFDLTAQTIAETARILEEDLSDWRSLYRRKNLSLNA